MDAYELNCPRRFVTVYIGVAYDRFDDRQDDHRLDREEQDERKVALLKTPLIRFEREVEKFNVSLSSPLG